MIMLDFSCFKAYDLRGRVPSTLNVTFAEALGHALVSVLQIASAVVGWDARLSSPDLSSALMRGLLNSGAHVSALGLCGTEEIYYATATQDFDLGIMVTGSHNPADENGFKLVRRGARPISMDSGLLSIKNFLASAPILKQRVSTQNNNNQSIFQISFRQDYIRFLLDSTKNDRTGRPLKIVADVGNGCAGLVLQELIPFLPYDFVLLRSEPDGHFPYGVPNPLLPEKREATANAVRQNHADLGLAWDGDFDRCFFYDAEGNFIEGYYLVGLLAQEMLTLQPGSKIVHDPRLYWNTRKLVQDAGGVPIMGKTGHAFMKERMRLENAAYGGEMSAHHYFRDFAYCDSGMLPWLMLVRTMSRLKKSLAELTAQCLHDFPCSGEINRKVEDAPRLLQEIRRRYAPDALYEDHLDGLNLEFRMWRFNLRLSNTEPLLRLNVESRGNSALMEDKTQELLQILDKNSL